jgi:SAM-dependent methyltransferase
MPSAVDEQYYEVAKPATLAERLMIAARDRIYDDFMAHMKPSETCRILDVGVSDVVSDGANVLERKYRLQKNITACGLGEGIEFQSAFPDVRYTRIEPNSKLPFGDHAFDIVTSNAVLEHVGSEDNQRAFIRELCRLGKKVFITVPNRYFPIEHHTAIPFLHYSDRSFAIACALLRKAHWSQAENLILMTRERLYNLAMQIDRAPTVGHTGLMLGHFSSNLYLRID